MQQCNQKQQLQIELQRIIDGLAQSLLASTPDARDTLRVALERYSSTYPEAYKYIHADNPLLSALLSTMEAHTKAKITQPEV